MVEGIIANLVWFSALFIVLCSSPGTLRQPLLLARERETCWHLFCPGAPYSSQVSEAGESEEEEDDFRFFQALFFWLP